VELLATSDQSKEVVQHASALATVGKSVTGTGTTATTTSAAVVPDEMAQTLGAYMHHKMPLTLDATDPQAVSGYISMLRQNVNNVIQTMACTTWASTVSVGQNETHSGIQNLVGLIMNYDDASQRIIKASCTLHDTIGSLKQQLQSQFRREADTVHTNLLNTLASANHSPDPKLFSLADYVKAHPEICAHLNTHSNGSTDGVVVQEAQQLSGSNSVPGAIQYTNPTRTEAATQQQQPCNAQSSTSPNTTTPKRTLDDMQGSIDSNSIQNENSHKKLATMFGNFCEQQTQHNKSFRVGNSLARQTVPLAQLTSHYQPNEMAHNINNDNTVSSRSSARQPGYSAQTSNNYPNMSDIFQTLDNQTLNGSSFPTVNMANRTQAYSNMI
jgi:hypothetical protein